jgi:AcrR family transcriptional regulator
MNTKKNTVKHNTTRDYILEQAVSLFASHGYSGVSNQRGQTRLLFDL